MTTAITNSLKTLALYATASLVIALSSTGASGVLIEAQFSPDLVAYFPVDSSTDSSNFLDDVIDDASHGTADGSTTSNLGAIVFDATRDGDVLSTVQGHHYDAGTQDIDLSDGFTWSFWVKSDSVANADSGADVIIGSRSGSWNKVQPGGTNATARFFDHTYDISDDTWYHVAYTGSTAANASGELSEFWIDGVKVSTDSNGTFNNLQVENTVLEIGGASQFSEEWTGLLDDIAIWERVLSDNDIKALAAGASIIAPTPAALPAGLALIGLVAARRRRRS